MEIEGLDEECWFRVMYYLNDLKTLGRLSRTSATMRAMVAKYQAIFPIVYNEFLAWRKGSLLHRENDLPAIVRWNGSKEWYREGKLHRDKDKPAVDQVDGVQIWFKNGMLCRDAGGPFIVQKGWNVGGRSS
jgi:hypothetical protein